MHNAGPIDVASRICLGVYSSSLKAPVSSPEGSNGKYKIGAILDSRDIDPSSNWLCLW